jgi:hypothetical protein
MSLYFITYKKSHWRLERLLNTWGYFMEQQPYVDNIYFVTVEKRGNRPYLVNHSVWCQSKFYHLWGKMQNPAGLNAQLIMKDLIIADHFWYNTTSDWCLRFTDDTFMYQPALHGFLEELAKMGDPKKIPIVLGNCLNHPNIGWYLQGGSGLLFSRAAIGKFLQIGEKWVLAHDMPEDWHLTSALRQMGLNDTQCNSRFFSGHFLRWALWGRWKWNDPQYFGPCPRKAPRQRYCNNQIVPYHEVLFHHALKDLILSGNGISG